jgi:hypothetical protein
MPIGAASFPDLFVMAAKLPAEFAGINAGFIMILSWRSHRVAPLLFS